MKSPLISIIITVLNGEKTLTKCLSSIATQTFSDYELVLVDGGSVDRTLQIVENSDIPNKQLYSFPGIGIYAGLNAGVKFSKGQWLYFIGADDELCDNKTLESISQVILAKYINTQIIVGNVHFVKQGFIFHPTFGKAPYWMRHEMHHQGMFYERNLFDNISYNEKMRIASDYELNLKLAISGVIHQYVNVVICNFGGEGISENQLKERYAEMDQVYERLFSGSKQKIILGYFWIRRRVGALLRRYNMSWVRISLKKLFA